jgi:hypothetical protein
MKHTLTTLLIAGVTIAQTAGAVPKKTLQITTNDHCVDVEIEQGTSEAFSCKFPKIISYSEKNCSDQKTIERGDVEAQLSCPDDSHWKIMFRTSKGIVSALLSPKREHKGKTGIVTEYRVKEASYQVSSNELPAPKVLYKSETGK